MLGRKERFMIQYLSDSLIPLLFLGIVCYGWRKKKNVYEDFLEGVTEGFKIVLRIAPTLVGLLMAVGMFRASGAMDMILSALKPVENILPIPMEVIPVILTKLFSSSAATGVLLDIFKECGTDSTQGFMASLILSSTETLFYTMSVYFLYINIRKTRWTLPGALFSTFFGVFASVIFTLALK